MSTQPQTIKAKRFTTKDGADNIIAIEEGKDVITWYRENRAADKFTVRKEVFEGISKNHKFDKDIEVAHPNPVVALREEVPKETKESVTATTATNTSDQ